MKCRSKKKNQHLLSRARHEPVVITSSKSNIGHCEGKVAILRTRQCSELFCESLCKRVVRQCRNFWIPEVCAVELVGCSVQKALR